MSTGINQEKLKYSYQLVLFSEVNYRIFLKSDLPEEKMLGILAKLLQTPWKWLCGTF